MSKNNSRSKQQSKRKGSFITGRRGVIGSLPDGWPAVDKESPRMPLKGQQAITQHIV